MKRIFVPTQTGSDWQRLLAKPKLHWKKGRSAMTTAACWEEGADTLPGEIINTLNTSTIPELMDLQLLLAIPEWEVPLKGGNTTSYTDVLAIVRNAQGLVVLAVEAKVDEEFGPTLKVKRSEGSTGQHERLDYLHSLFGIEGALDDSIRYQLLHRTGSALLIAQEFHAPTAVMLVHSFSATSRWREDFEAFCIAIGAENINSNVKHVPTFKNPRLFLVWCQGNQKFKDVELPTIVYRDRDAHH